MSAHRGRSLTARGRRLLAALGVTALVAAGVAIAPVTAAQAATPSQFSLSFPTTFPPDTTTCGFPIITSLQITLVGRTYLDSHGNFVGMTIENSNVGTDTGNGVTLRENDHYVDHIDALGFDGQTGLELHIQGGGLVVRDAGFIVFAPDGSITAVHGPHPFIEGDPAAIVAYCAAFS
jgi:hypothetical protein